MTAIDVSNLFVININGNVDKKFQPSIFNRNREIQL